MKFYLILFILLAGCGGSGNGEKYASYEDCILGSLGSGQTKLATQEIIWACRSKFPEIEPSAADRAAAMSDMAAADAAQAAAEDAEDAENAADAADAAADAAEQAQDSAEQAAAGDMAATEKWWDADPIAKENDPAEFEAAFADLVPTDAAQAAAGQAAAAVDAAADPVQAAYEEGKAAYEAGNVANEPGACIVYSYDLSDGSRHYSSKPPTSISTDDRIIPYRTIPYRCISRSTTK